MGQHTRGGTMILVTGATGFVGKALLDLLDREGISYRPVSRTARKNYVQVTNIDADTDWSQALAGVETVIHLAARVHVMKESTADPLVAFRTMNVDATINLASQAAALGVKRFVFISSIKVNGEATKPGHPFTAEDIPAPVDAYGQSKLEAEQALFQLGNKTGMEIVVVRPPLVYGPCVKANFAALIRWAGSRVPFPFGAARNARSLVYVENLVDLIVLCVHHPAAANEVFCVSDDEDLSTAELFRRLSTLQGGRSRIVAVPVRLLTIVFGLIGKAAEADRLLGSLQVDIAKTRSRLSWAPTISCDEGLRRTVERLKR